MPRIQGTHIVTTRHNASAPATFLRHSASQTRTGPRRQRLFRVTARHKVAQGPSASDFSASQRVTNSPGAEAPAKSNRHSASQTRTRPQRQQLFSVTARHKLAQSFSTSDFSASQRVTNSQGAEAPAKSNRHSGFQPSQFVTNSHGTLAPPTSLRHSEALTRTGLRRQRPFTVTARHKLS